MNAWLGEDPRATQIVDLFGDKDKTIVSTSLVRLELVPKATFNGNKAEVAFYESLFGKVEEWCEVNDGVVEKAIEFGCRHDVMGVDAMHVAAAAIANVDEFLTDEGEGKPLHRVTEANPITLDSVLGT